MKWLRNVNEKASVAQAIAQVKALERKNRSSERAIGAPVISTATVPIPLPTYTGVLPSASLPVPFVSHHLPITFDSEPEAPLDQGHIYELTENVPESSSIPGNHQVLVGPSSGVLHASQGEVMSKRKRKDRYADGTDES